MPVTAASPLSATLHEIALFSPRPDALAEFYRGAMGYQFAEEGEHRAGKAKDRRLRILPGDANTLAYAAFAVPSVHELVVLERRLIEAGHEVQKVSHSSFLPSALQFADPDGNVFVFGVPSGGATESFGDPDADRTARLQHIVFASTDIERMLAFFTEVVGFTLSDRVEDEAGALRTVFMRCSEEHHSLAVFAAGTNRPDHHCYEATEWSIIRDWADHFSRQQIQLKWGPGRHGPGDNLFIFIHDPDGNWVEVSAELERVEPDRPVGNWPHEERTLNLWGAGLLRS